MTKKPNKPDKPDKPSKPDVKQAAAEVRRLLPQLSSQDAKELRLLLDTYHKPEADHRDADWLLSGIQYELRRRGLGCPPLTTRLVNKLAPNAPAEAVVVRDILVESAKRSAAPLLSTTQWLALGQLCIKELGRYLTGGPSPPPLSPSVLLMNISKIPQALDAAFPGYLQSGMIHFLVRTYRPPGADEDVTLLPDRTRRRSEARYQDKRFPPRKRSKPDDDEDRVWSEDEFNAEVERQEEIKRKGLEAAAKLAAEDRDFMTEDEFNAEVERQNKIKEEGLIRAAALEVEDQDFWTEDQFNAEVEKQEANKKAGLERAKRQDQSAADDRRERAALRRYHGTSPNEDDDEEHDDDEGPDDEG